MDNLKPRRRLPAPWRVIEHEESFEVVDANGQNLAYVYFDEREISRIKPRLSRDEARRVAAGIAKLPDLLGKK